MAPEASAEGMPASASFQPHLRSGLNPLASEELASPLTTGLAERQAARSSDRHLWWWPRASPLDRTLALPAALSERTPNHST